MGRSPITSIYILYIDFCGIKWFSYFKCYFIENFVSEGSRFLSPGVGHENNLTEPDLQIWMSLESDSDVCLV